MSRFDVYCRKRIGQVLGRKLATRSPGNPIISFTFDDFPRSALTVAGEMLCEHGLRGTFYVSMGLTGQSSSQGETHTKEDLRTLVETGHELACHTFTHLFCPRASASDIQRECSRNRKTVFNTIDGYRLRNFSYPSGAVTWSAKTALAMTYDSCRTVESGINYSPVDLGFLRANPMYSSRPIEDLLRLIDGNTKEGGWLVLYTHDVRERPSTVGCTPEYFREILLACISSGSKVMTVADAVSNFQLKTQPLSRAIIRSAE